MNKNIKQICSASKAVKGLRRPGLTLTELLISIVIIALLAAFSIPAIDAFMNSMGSTGSATALINAALSSARAMAIKEQRYVGVRFQFYFDPRDMRPLAPRDMYMIFIEQDPKLGAYFFRAIEGLKPIKLPPNIGVMDLKIVKQRKINNPVNPDVEDDLLTPITQNPASVDGSFDVDTPEGQRNLFDISTFSIVFSPSGNMVIHGVTVKPSSDTDEVFNTGDIVYANAVQEIATFMQDDTENATAEFAALGPEPSRRYFLIFERDKYRAALSKKRLCSDYLKLLIDKKGLTFINPYTGTLIEAE